jgi:hypothetical protein
MLSLKWYTDQLHKLPEESRHRLNQQLLRAARRGDLPSRRQWTLAVQRAARFWFG